MPSKNQIEEILRDCLAADPSLREREDELRPIIKALLESKPDTRFSTEFADRLHDALANERQKRNGKIRVTPSPFGAMKLKPIAFPIVGSLALVAVFALLLVQKPPGAKTSTVATVQQPKPHGMQIAKVADGAFGPLAATTVQATRPLMADGYEEGRNAAGAAPMAAPSAAMGMDTAVSAHSQNGGGGTASSSKMAAIMPVQQPVNYRYVYKGELPPIDAKIAVYRHVKGLTSGNLLPSFGNITGGLMDGSHFSSGALQSLNVVEDRDYGYGIFLDATEGGISMNQNWQRWPHPESKCRDEACYQQYQLKPDQMPADDVVIGVAEDFIKEYGIDRSALGKPSINSDWRIRPMGVAADMPLYVPDVVSVSYPYLIDGKTVQDESGNVNGVTVNVDVREKKVDGLWGLLTNRYEQSSYDAETDTARLLKFVSNGGLYPVYDDSSAKTVEIALGEPEVVLVAYWKDNGDGTGQNLYVPTLRFTVQNPPADQPWFRKAVTVPLSKDLLDQADKQAAGQGGGVPTPVMYMKDGVK